MTDKLVEKCLLTDEEELARVDEYWELYRDLWNEGIIDEADYESGFDYWRLEAQLTKAYPIIKEAAEKERLDRPELREKLYHILPNYARKVDEIAELGLIHSKTRAKWGVLLEETLDQILALIPDERKKASKIVGEMQKMFEDTLAEDIAEARKAVAEEIWDKAHAIGFRAGVIAERKGSGTNSGKAILDKLKGDKE